MENQSGGWPFFGSMFVIILSIVSYQVLQKSISVNIHPVVSVIISYIIALIGSFLLLLIFPLKNDFYTELSKANVASFLVGIAIIGIEIGFLLAYRNGWKLGLAMPFTSSVSILVLTLIGFLFFKEQISPIKIAGILLCISGIILLNK
ncbi:MAG: EamA family transporter [Bacteroidetes bacterium]|nr:EamA family transporter [Bacteroidota bacterium]